MRADRIDSVVVHVDSGTLDVTATNGTSSSVQGPPGGIPDADTELLDAHHVARNYAGTDSSWFGRA